MRGGRPRGLTVVTAAESDGVAPVVVRLRPSGRATPQSARAQAPHSARGRTPRLRLSRTAPLRMKLPQCGSTESSPTHGRAETALPLAPSLMQRLVAIGTTPVSTKGISENDLKARFVPNCARRRAVLAACPALCDVDHSVLERVAASSTIGTFEKNASVLHTGQQCERFSLLVSGCVLVLKDVKVAGAQGTRLVERCTSGALLGVTSLMSAAPSRIDCICDEDCEILQLSAELFHAYLAPLAEVWYVGIRNLNAVREALVEIPTLCDVLTSEQRAAFAATWEPAAKNEGDRVVREGQSFSEGVIAIVLSGRLMNSKFTVEHGIQELPPTLPGGIVGERALYERTQRQRVTVVAGVHTKLALLRTRNLPAGAHAQCNNIWKAKMLDRLASIKSMQLPAAFNGRAKRGGIKRVVSIQSGALGQRRQRRGRSRRRSSFFEVSDADRAAASAKAAKMLKALEEDVVEETAQTEGEAEAEEAEAAAKRRLEEAQRDGELAELAALTRVKTRQLYKEWIVLKRHDKTLAAPSLHSGMAAALVEAPLSLNDHCPILAGGVNLRGNVLLAERSITEACLGALDLEPKQRDAEHLKLIFLLVGGAPFFARLTKGWDATTPATKGLVGLMRSARLHRVAAEQRVYSPKQRGEAVLRLYVVISGRVRIDPGVKIAAGSYLPEARQHFAEAGHVFGEAPFWGIRKRFETARATHDSVLLSIPVSGYRAVCAEMRVRGAQQELIRRGFWHFLKMPLLKRTSYHPLAIVELHRRAEVLALDRHAIVLPRSQRSDGIYFLIEGAVGGVNESASSVKKLGVECVQRLVLTTAAGSFFGCSSLAASNEVETLTSIVLSPFAVVLRFAERDFKLLNKALRSNMKIMASERKRMRASARRTRSCATNREMRANALNRKLGAANADSAKSSEAKLRESLLPGGSIACFSKAALGLPDFETKRQAALMGLAKKAGDAHDKAGGVPRRRRARKARLDTGQRKPRSAEQQRTAARLVSSAEGGGDSFSRKGRSLDAESPHASQIRKEEMAHCEELGRADGDQPSEPQATFVVVPLAERPILYSPSSSGRVFASLAKASVPLASVVEEAPAPLSPSTTFMTT